MTNNMRRVYKRRKPSLLGPSADWMTAYTDTIMLALYGEQGLQRLHSRRLTRLRDEDEEQQEVKSA